VLAAASAAREAFARGLALELAPLRVNTLAPKPIDTPLLARILGAHRDAPTSRPCPSACRRDASARRTRRVRRSSS
jgi:NAD(P)-dependent dehydrogenase (short-subunit alcohol dehydrogenase family)